MVEERNLSLAKHSTIRQEELDRMPQPLKEEVSRSVHTVVQGRLLGDDPVRYGKKMAERIVALPEDTTKSLLALFGPRLTVVPFTVDGFPSNEEVQLTNDLWSSVSDAQKKAMIERAAEVVAEKRHSSVDKVPDETPYVKRLLHRFMQIRSRQD